MRRFLLCAAFIVLSAASPSSGEETRAMSIEAKAGQVLALAFRGFELDEETSARMERIRPGGIILYGWNVQSTGQVRCLVSDLRRSIDWEDPPMVAVDQEGGPVARIRSDGADFPGLMALGATGDPDLARRQGSIMGRQLRSLGIDVDYAPVMDVNSNPSNPIIGVRSFGDSAERVSAMGIAMIEGFLSSGVGCSAKHFPGHGDVDLDSHLDLPRLNRSLGSLSVLELLPFRAAIDAGVPAVMTAHIVIPDVTGHLPATLSTRAVSILREDLGFKGVILSDSMGMKAISDKWGVPEGCVMALKAGVDMVLLGADPAFPPERHGEVHRRIVEAVRTGELDEARLDEAISRIREWKKTLGLYADDSRPEWEDGTALSMEIARRSITLIRSDGTLPLKGKRICLLWPEPQAEKGRLLAEALERKGLKVSFVKFGSCGDLETRAKDLEEYDAVLIGAYDLSRERCPSALFGSAGVPGVLLSMKTPYDVISIPSAGTALACYGDRPSTLEALSDVLTGKPPLGRLPVEIPGAYPSGWGLSDF